MSKRGFSLLFGALIGTLTGLLFAPGKGKELRKKVKNEIDKGGAGVESVTYEVKKMAKDMKESFNEWIETDEMQDVIKKGKKAVDEAKKKGKVMVDEISKEINNEMHDMEAKTRDALVKASKSAKKTARSKAKNTVKQVKKKVVKAKKVVDKKIEKTINLSKSKSGIKKTPVKKTNTKKTTK